MFSWAKRLWNDRRGNVLVIMGAGLPVLIGAAGLGTDTVQWVLWKRQLQRAADSAAIAGVYGKVQGQNVGTAVSRDLTLNNHTKISLLSGYPAITYPADTATTWNAVSVELRLQKKLGFSSLFMSEPPVIRATGIAATTETGVYCVVSLRETDDTGIKATGNGTIDLGCGMITNSTSMTAAIATGSAAVNATPIAAVGNITASDNWGEAELLPFTVKQPDPFEDVEPSTTNCPGSPLRVNSNATATVNAGCYSSMTLNGDVTLNDGTYIIDGGDLSIGAQAKVRCNACTFVLTNRSTSATATIGSVNMNGGAQINLAAPTSGTYDGILFYQDRRASSASNTINRINGNSDSTFSGAFYFPKQSLEVNGTAGLDFTCGRFVAYDVTFSGNGSLNNTCTGGYGDDAITGRHVRLIG